MKSTVIFGNGLFSYMGADPRREKRALGRTTADAALYDAYVWGEANNMRRRPISNPYPAGRRHDEFERGMANADLMGQHHGRNE